MRRNTLVFIGIALLVMVLLGVFFLTRPKEPVTIGFVSGLSGKYADLGVDCRRGVEQAIIRINETGGVNGRPVRMIAKDDGHDEAMALAAVSSLIKSKVPVIIGHATSSMTMTTLPLVAGTDILLIGPTTSTSRLQDLDDNFIRVCAVSTAAAADMARYLYEAKGVRAAGIIYDLGNEAYTSIWYDSFQKTFLEIGGDRVEPLTFVSSSDQQLLPLIVKMKSRQVDALVIIANSVDAAMLCQQARKAGWQVPIALADWAATEQLINLGGTAVEGVTIQQFFNRKSKSPPYLQFRKSFEDQYRVEPGFGALHAYNAAMMAFTAMKEKNKDETLKEAILRISIFKGLQRDIKINRYGDADHPTAMGEVRNGEIVLLKEY